MHVHCLSLFSGASVTPPAPEKSQGRNGWDSTRVTLGHICMASLLRAGLLGPDTNLAPSPASKALLSELGDS